MPRRHLQINPELASFTSLEDAQRAYEDLLQQLNESLAHLEQLESFVRSEDGQTFTLSGDLDMDGNRIRNLPQTRFEDEPPPRSELRQHSIFATGSSAFDIRRSLVAQQPITTPPAVLPSQAVSLSQLGQQLLSSLPVGVIVLWSSVSIPAGWHLCDGTSGTPDIRISFDIQDGATEVNFIMKIT